MNQVITDPSRIEEVLTKGVKEVFPGKEQLMQLLMSGQRIKLYTGIDPTANFIHMGHMIWMKKLAQFQELGHEVIFLIGGFTAMIGDPDKKYSREPLSKEQVEANFQNYKADASRILNFDHPTNPVRVLNNYDWLSKLNLEDWIEITSQVTLQHILSHDMFRNRLESELPIRLHEIMYPLMQGFDSVHMGVDLEVGGSDQTFNMLTGRILARNLKNKEKFVLTLKLLTDNSGNKMGKTTNNSISFKDTPQDVYGKIMSMSDEVVPLAYELLSNKTMKDIESLKDRMNTEPMKVKKELAFELTTLIHSNDDAQKAQTNFESVVQSGSIPDEMDSFDISNLILQDGYINIVNLVSTVGGISKGEGKRLTEQGGIKIDNDKIQDTKKDILIKSGIIIQIGKRKWYKLN